MCVNIHERRSWRYYRGSDTGALPPLSFLVCISFPHVQSFDSRLIGIQNVCQFMSDEVE
jgi:hypothetical protein